MAIGSVTELVDYKQETIKIAQKYGGGSSLEPRVHELELDVGQLSSSVLSIGLSVSQLSASVLTIAGNVEDLEEEKTDLTVIADTYNPEKTTQTAYTKDDCVTYNNKLWKANDNIRTKAGAFNSEMWDAIENYDSAETYNQGDLVVYSGTVYSCISVEPVTGEWDSTKWYSQTANSYDANYLYYSTSSLVEYEEVFYKANSNYHNAPLGNFDSTLWTEKSVESAIADNVPKQVSGSLYGLTTDEDGMISNADLLTKVPALSGKKILNVYAFPYQGMAPYGKTGFFLTRVNPNYWLLENCTNGGRVAVTSQELDGKYVFTFIYV